MPWGINHIFLLVNVVAMTGASILVIARKYSEYAVGGLIGVVITQALGYGLIFDLNFFLRNLSVMGGLIMVLSDSWVRKKFAPAGLPQLDEKDRKMYFQLAGRVLLIFLFIGFVFAGSWSFGRVMVILVGAVACVMVVVGFKAKWSAIVLVMILSIFNILVNNFWTVSHETQTLLEISARSAVLTWTFFSSTHTTHTRTSPSTTSSRSSLSWAVCCCWSTWGQVKSALTRRRRSTRKETPGQSATRHESYAGCRVAYMARKLESCFIASLVFKLESETRHHHPSGRKQILTLECVKKRKLDAILTNKTVLPTTCSTTSFVSLRLVVYPYSLLIS